jgi:Domain of unknown function (DUF4350)
MRGWLLAGAAVLAAFALIGVLEAFEPAPQGPAGSSYATSVHGAAAWASLLSRDGHPVARLRTGFATARLRRDETLVVVQARTIGGARAAARLRRFVSGGGRLVLAGVSGPAARSVLGGPPGRGGGVAEHRLGHGRITVLGDPHTVENSGLARGGNALLALRIAGPRGRPVEFAEAVHGYTAATGLAAFPARWWATFAGLALAAGAWALARGRRLGPAEAPAPEPIPPRAAYVDAMAHAIVAGRRARRTANDRHEVNA